MPEGPEVRTIADCLNEVLAGKVMINFEYMEGTRFSKSGIPGFELLSVPLTLYQVYAYGKKIVFDFHPIYIVSCLSMFGGWFFEESKHTCIRMSFNDVAGSEIIACYDDQMNWGQLWIYENDPSPAFKHQGLDLLSDDITPEIYLHAARKHNKWRVTKFLMEQKPFAGVGNYLKSEILYACRFSPFRFMYELSDHEIELLRQVTLEIIHESYRCGGLSFKIYKDPFKRDGIFKKLVYEQEQDPEGRKVETVTLEDKRVTHWVPEIQH